MELKWTKIVLPMNEWLTASIGKQNDHVHREQGKDDQMSTIVLEELYFYIAE